MPTPKSFLGDTPAVAVPKKQAKQKPSFFMKTATLPTLNTEEKKERKKRYPFVEAVSFLDDDGF